MKPHVPGAADLHYTLYAYALDLADGDKDLAKKLLHDTLMHISRTAATYNPSTNFTVWAKATMKNIYYNKHHGDSIHHLHRLCYHGIPAHTATFEESSYSTRHIYRTMSRMSPSQAAAITLRLKGYTHCQIARKMGTTTSLAKHHLIMARRILDKIWYN